MVHYSILGGGEREGVGEGGHLLHTSIDISVCVCELQERQDTCANGTATSIAAKMRVCDALAIESMIRKYGLRNCISKTTNNFAKHKYSWQNGRCSNCQMQQQATELISAINCELPAISRKFRQWAPTLTVL